MSLDVGLSLDIDTGDKELMNVLLFDANVTHNLAVMADKAGIYQALWRPETLGVSCAKDIVDSLETGLKRLIEAPEYFKGFEAYNGWGKYEDFVHFVDKYLTACKSYPKAKILTSV